jgi:GntR family transcriptional regulator, carbon starvation induced regulator
MIDSSQAPHRGLVGGTLAFDVFHRLRDDIISCVLKPGEKLKFERLRAIYAVSFSTLREALSKLASEGLVEVRGQQGFRVAPVSPKDLTDLTDLRILVEMEAIRLAIARGDQNWETALLGSYHRMDREQKEHGERYQLSQSWCKLHREFHDALANGCDSPPLLDIRRALFERSDRYRRISASFRTAPRSNRNEHREMMEAALDRNPVRCAELIRSHIRLTAEFVLAASDEWR